MLLHYSLCYITYIICFAYTTYFPQIPLSSFHHSFPICLCFSSFLCFIFYLHGGCMFGYFTFHFTTLFFFLSFIWMCIFNLNDLRRDAVNMQQQQKSNTLFLLWAADLIKKNFILWTRFVSGYIQFSHPYSVYVYCNMFRGSNNMALLHIIESELFGMCTLYIT